jgi:hypothetical protein
LKLSNIMSIKNLKPSVNSKYEQNYYRLVNPLKYKGDPNKIIYRSSYEKRMCQICDSSDKIIQWSSEPIAIMYTSLFDGKRHKYWLDFWFKYYDGREFIIEVKPLNKLNKPKAPAKKTTKALENYNFRMKEYLVNYSKFKAASEFAQQTGLEFVIVDEKFLFSIT